MSSEKPNKINCWLLASRPKTLLASIVPVLIGSALAYRFSGFEWNAALVALLCSVLIQVATNFVNDLYDFKKGTDDAERLGPPRALAAGLLSPKEMKLGIYITFGLAFLMGLYLVYIAGWPILAVGILSLISGYAYTAGPFPLAYNGLGDVFVFLFFGVVGTVGTFYVQTLELINQAYVVSIPVGLLITNILVVNNYRDRIGDKKSNKNTLIVLLGGRFGQLQYSLSILVSYAIPVYLFALHGYSIIIMLPLLTLPLGIILVKMIFTLEGKALNKTLELTAKFSFVFSLLFAAGIVL